jgi:hypothetical protein
LNYLAIFGYITNFSERNPDPEVHLPHKFEKKKLSLWLGAGERRRRKKKVSKREPTAQTDLEERRKKQARKTSH